MGAGRELVSLGKIKAMVFLIHIFKEMPRDKTYEDWAFKEYGNALLTQK